MKKRRIRLIVMEIIGLALGILYLVPFYVVVTNSLKSKRNILIDTIGLPETLGFENYPRAMEKMDFLKSLSNSLIITVLSLLLLILFSSMSSWVLVRTKTKISNAILLLFVAAMMIPFQSVMLPLVNLFGVDKLNLVNTRMGIIIMYIGFGSSMSVFLYHGFMKTIPLDLELAASIDGCNPVQTFIYIVLPLIKPISVTVAILNGIWIWNDFLLPSLVLQDKAIRTIPLAAQYFFGAFSKDWHLAMAGLNLAIIPIIIFYIFAQKYIIKGVISGALK